MTNPTPSLAGTAETMTADDRAWLMSNAKWLSRKSLFAERLADRILATYAALAERTAECERLTRTMEFQAAEYLKAHGGSWGECKWQAELTALRASLATAQEIITEAQASYDSVNFAYPTDDDGRTMEAMILRLSKGKRICGDFAKDIMPDAARPHATPETDNG